LQLSFCFKGLHELKLNGIGDALPLLKINGGVIGSAKDVLN
jgi:hypothetical protein